MYDKARDLAIELWKSLFDDDPPVAEKPDQANPYTDKWDSSADNLVTVISVLEKALPKLKKIWKRRNRPFNSRVSVTMYGDTKADEILYEAVMVRFTPFIARTMEIDMGDVWYPHGRYTNIGFKLSTKDSWVLHYPEDPHYFFDDVFDK